MYLLLRRVHRCSGSWSIGSIHNRYFFLNLGSSLYKRGELHLWKTWVRRSYDQSNNCVRVSEIIEHSLQSMQRHILLIKSIVNFNTRASKNTPWSLVMICFKCEYSLPLLWLCFGSFPTRIVHIVCCIILCIHHQPLATSRIHTCIDVSTFAALSASIMLNVSHGLGHLHMSTMTCISWFKAHLLVPSTTT